MQTNKSVLIIDPHQGFRSSVEEFLTKIGYRVMGAHEGEKGLQICRRERPGLVLCSTSISDVAAFDLCAHVKQSPELGAIPVVLLGDRDTKNFMKEAANASADFTIRRPVTANDLGVDLYFLFDRNFEISAEDQSCLRVTKPVIAPHPETVMAGPQGGNGQEGSSAVAEDSESDGWVEPFRQEPGPAVSEPAPKEPGPESEVEIKPAGVEEVVDLLRALAGPLRETRDRLSEAIEVIERL